MFAVKNRPPENRSCFLVLRSSLLAVGFTVLVGFRRFPRFSAFRLLFGSPDLRFFGFTMFLWQT